MLPFLRRRQEAGSSSILTTTRRPDEGTQDEASDDPAAAIEACAQDLIQAVHAKDVKATAEALQAAFEILESMPHEESPHTYEDQAED